MVRLACLRGLTISVVQVMRRETGVYMVKVMTLLSLMLTLAVSAMTAPDPAGTAPASPGTSAEQKAGSLYSAGERAFAQGDYLSAVVAWEDVLALKPSSALAQKRLAATRPKMTNAEIDAGLHLRAAVRAWTSGDTATGDSEIDQAQKHAPNAECITRAIEEHTVTTLYLTGEACFAHQDYLSAAIAWEDTLLLKPTSNYTEKRLAVARSKMNPEDSAAAVHYRTALRAWAQGDLDAADTELAQARERVPNAQCIARAVEDLAQAREEKNGTAAGKQTPVAIVIHGNATAEASQPTRPPASGVVTVTSYTHTRGTTIKTTYTEPVSAENIKTFRILRALGPGWVCENGKFMRGKYASAYVTPWEISHMGSRQTTRQRLPLPARHTH